MSLLNLIKDEKIKCKKEKNGNRHRAMRDVWAAIRRILDQIYALRMNKRVPIYKKYNGNITRDQERQKEYLDDVIDDLEKQKIIKKYYPDYITIENHKKFDNYYDTIKEFCDWIEKDGQKRFGKFYHGEEQKNLIEFKNDHGKCQLHIWGVELIQFKGLKCEIIDFFYNSADRKTFKTYEDIKTKISGRKTEIIRSSIKKINETIFKKTNREYDGLIEIVSQDDNPKSPKKYKWKY